jgi:hypothetical protein
MVGKFVSNTRAIARQLHGKRVPATTDTYAAIALFLEYNNGNSVFYVVHAEMF